MPYTMKRDRGDNVGNFNVLHSMAIFQDIYAAETKTNCDSEDCMILFDKQ